MPEINGITLARRLAEDCPGVCVIILTLYEERSFLKQALAAGVKGYVLKRSGGGKSGVRHSGGQSWRDLCRSLAPRRVTRRRSPLGDKVPQSRGASGIDGPRSQRPQIFRPRTDDEGNCRAAGVSAKTVETYKFRASRETGLRTRAEIVRFASVQGWLEDI